MRVAGWVVLVAGCGRIGFAERTDAMTGAMTDTTSMMCPAGFVGIAGNASLGTTDFCAMQTEPRAWLDTNADQIVDESELDADGCSTAACDTDWSTASGFLPVSVLPVQAEPWRAVSAVAARTVCGLLGAKYDIMSNREWMTIARTAELDGRNWYGNVVGNTRIVQGQIDGTGTSAIADPNDGYTGTNDGPADPPGSGWEERRTLYVGDAILWDLPGSNQEWVDWTLGTPLNGAPTPCTNAELPLFACPGITADDFQSSTGTYTSPIGVGTIIGGSGSATRRGGQDGDIGLGIAGIYGLNMNRDVFDTFPATSFRCVYRP
jgi:hypothetical protein